MGIDGLLTLLKPLIKKQHISEFRNKTLAVDALPWIYKGIYGANIQLGQNIDQNPNAFLYYIIEMIDMLEFYKIKPIFVFDGKSLTAKNKTIEKRRKSKQQQKSKAQQLLKNNQTQKANKTLARYISIDESKLALVMSLLKLKNIKFCIAPYEADSQISKMFNLGLVDAVITEDSDLVVYGVDVILKLKETGQCDFLSLKQDQDQVIKFQCPFLRKFCNFTHQQRIQTAILSGCDYVDSVKGIGVKKAIKLVEQNESLEKVVECLKKDPKIGDKVPQNYLELVQNAKLIFMFAKTFNPLVNELQYLRQSQLNEFHTEQKMEAQELDQIVGKGSEFSTQHYLGEINCKTQTKRTFPKICLKEIYSLSRQNINNQASLYKQKDERRKAEAKELMIDETTSICWECDSLNEGLMFLLQKQLVGQFFTQKENPAGPIVQSSIKSRQENQK